MSTRFTVIRSRRLPARAPAWSDANAADPGVSAVQLPAFITEPIIYRQERAARRFIALALAALVTGVVYSAARRRMRMGDTAGDEPDPSFS